MLYPLYACLRICEKSDDVFCFFYFYLTLAAYAGFPQSKIIATNKIVGF